MHGKCLRGIGAALAIALVLSLGALGWPLYDNGPAPAGRFPLDLAAIRAEASRLPGAPPDRIEVEVLTAGFREGAVK